MSDGPHRSLQMRSHWKEVAFRADKVAFSKDEIAEAGEVALMRDWLELPPEFRGAISRLLGNETQASLFTPSAQEIQTLRHLAAGASLGVLIAECTAQAIDDGAAGVKALHVGIFEALGESVLRRSRQIEEHYCREADANRASRVRGRVESAISNGSLSRIATQIVNGTWVSGQKRTLKKTALDDGVPI